MAKHQTNPWDEDRVSEVYYPLKLIFNSYNAEEHTFVQMSYVDIIQNMEITLFSQLVAQGKIRNNARMLQGLSGFKSGLPKSHPDLSCLPTSMMRGVIHLLWAFGLRERPLTRCPF